jgi:hypothetical protein
MSVHQGVSAAFPQAADQQEYSRRKENAREQEGLSEPPCLNEPSHWIEVHQQEGRNEQDRDGNTLQKIFHGFSPLVRTS